MRYISTSRRASTVPCNHKLLQQQTTHVNSTRQNLEPLVFIRDIALRNVVGFEQKVVYFMGNKYNSMNTINTVFYFASLIHNNRGLL